MPSAIGMARGMVFSGSVTSSPSVAMRAYPAKAKNINPAACSTPYAVTSPPSVSRAASAPPKPSSTVTTSASTASTAATMIRVSNAERWTPA